MKVRIIIKQTQQPPIDTPASITHKTVVVESEALYNAIHAPECKYTGGQVIGAEIIDDETG